MGLGSPPLSARLMAGLAILKYTYDLSGEKLCAAWLENPYFQSFCSEEFFQHKLVFNRSSITHWRQRMGKQSPGAFFRKVWLKQPKRKS